MDYGCGRYIRSSFCLKLHIFLTILVAYSLDIGLIPSYIRFITVFNIGIL